MLQRSTHTVPVDVPAIPATVLPGESVDWPDPIAGFEAVKDETPAEPDTPAKTTRKRTGAADTPEV